MAPAKEAVAEPVKFARKLSKLTLEQVNRQIRKAARRAATARYLLEQMSPAGKFRAAVQSQQDAQIHRLKQACAERTARIQSN